MTKGKVQTVKDVKRAATAADLIDIMEEVRYLAVNTQNACDAGGLADPYFDYGSLSPAGMAAAIKAAHAAVRYARKAQNLAAELHNYDKL